MLHCREWIVIGRAKRRTRDLKQKNKLGGCSVELLHIKMLFGGMEKGCPGGKEKNFGYREIGSHD